MFSVTLLCLLARWTRANVGVVSSIRNSYLSIGARRSPGFGSAAGSLSPTTSVVRTSARPWVDRQWTRDR